MKRKMHINHRTPNFVLLLGLLIAWTLAGCTAMNPKPEMLKLPVEPPVKRVTSFNTALTQLGILSEIHGVKMLKIQIRDIEDATGTAYHSKGEIPQNISVMVKSALNAIGGRVVYIPFWPDYFAGIQVSGYPVSQQKLVPDVILAGGITEFDRGLATVDRTHNFDVETKDVLDEATALPGRRIGLDYEKGDKWSKAKIAVDFNLISYQALCGIPKMQASNGITVYKGITEEEFGFTLFGPTIGLKGSIKKVQGRHDAVRLLVQYSVIQLVGRFLDLPYWQLLDGAQPDPVVLETLKSNYQQEDLAGQTLMLKRLLWIRGHSVPVNGEMDAQTAEALNKLDMGFDSQTASVPVDTFIDLYLSVPIDSTSRERANKFDQLWSQLQTIEEQKNSKATEKPARPAKPKKRKIEKQDQPLERSKPKDSKPKATESPEDAPKPEIIIITPLDAQTHHTMGRFLRRIEIKRKGQPNNGATPYQQVFYKHGTQASTQ